MYIPVKVGDVWYIMDGRRVEEAESKVVIKEVMQSAATPEYDFGREVWVQQTVTYVTALDLTGVEHYYPELTFKNLYWKPF